jgi:UDP-N-acetylglucosamine 2-epimerase
MGCIAAAQLNIPIVHIEGCMRSYDWRMPEEKYRTAIDHLSDVIYAYFDEYKEQGVLEGLIPENIIVVQNLIVDVLNAYYFERQDYFSSLATPGFFATRGLSRGEYYLATCHRRENVEDASSLSRVFDLFKQSRLPVHFAASYRTQKNIQRYGLTLPSNVSVVDPIGYEEMLLLMTNARGIFTDSGTVVEEAAILQVPSVQMRRSTERPQVYDCRSSIKFDPGNPERFSPDNTIARFDLLVGTKWEHRLGDGAASTRIVSDLMKRLAEENFAGHSPQCYSQRARVARSWRDDAVS